MVHHYVAVKLCSAAICLTVGTVAVQAETVAWWRFEEPQTQVDKLASEVNSPLMDSTLGQNGVYLTKHTPGRIVTDGKGAEKMMDNTQSLLENGSDPNLLSAPGATEFLNKVFVEDRASWTWETFVYLRPSVASIPYGTLFGNGTDESQGIRFDMGSDSHHPRFLSNGILIVEGPFLEEERWYHLAVVATWNEVGDWNVEMFLDYEPVAVKTGVKFDAVNNGYGIASPKNPFDSYVDEMRISNSALTPEQMLHVLAD